MKNEFTIRSDLSLILFENDYTVEEASLLTGVSRRTLFNVLSNSFQPNEETLEKVYSFIYKDGYRLNQIKEEIYKDTDKLILFHGAKNQIENITFDGSRKNCDFGSGFYLGESYYQSVNFICEKPKGSVYMFIFDDRDLKIKEFECGLDWIIAICYYRGKIEKYKDHPMVKKVIKQVEEADVIIAPIADNKMFQIMQLFAEGEITTTQAFYSLSSSTLGKQYVLKSEKAINKLQQLERLYVCGEEKAYYSERVISHAEEIDEKLKEAKRKYRKEGLFIDELFK